MTPYAIYHRDGSVTINKDAVEPHISVKWPAFLVQGTSVTEVQAVEILFRTSSARLCLNDRKFESFYYDLLGFPDQESLDMAVINAHYEHARALGFLELGYLANSQIASSWIGGPNGWMNWDGQIHCSNKNIGKWPSVQEVSEDWAKIAKAFPFLDLRCQLLNHEAGYPEGESRVTVEFVIKDGTVTVFEPADPKPMMPATDAKWRNLMSLSTEHISKDALKKYWKIFQDNYLNKSP